ncbi:LPXTG cell wall anchor domain-containing protein [Erysipelothrix inopinata]|uniref:LPXTG cell wall anchor domain-containing protein n=1 Tax=Erysipelothrix inopinata TaxID=225084 RepID=A0A7G9RYV7_9FIRM|nr:LPXTG cell wall anchor domain-containing protein [Erysipelothrix inopinata]
MKPVITIDNGKNKEQINKTPTLPNTGIDNNMLMIGGIVIILGCGASILSMKNRKREN